MCFSDKVSIGRALEDDEMKAIQALLCESASSDLEIRSVGSILRAMRFSKLFTTVQIKRKNEP